MREVVRSPNSYDLLSQPLLRPTCQRSQVRPGPGAEESWVGQEKRTCLASPGLEARSHPLPPSTFKLRLRSAFPRPAPRPPFLHL